MLHPTCIRTRLLSVVRYIGVHMQFTYVHAPVLYTCTLCYQLQCRPPLNYYNHVLAVSLPKGDHYRELARFHCTRNNKHHVFITFLEFQSEW